MARAATFGVAQDGVGGADGASVASWTGGPSPPVPAGLGPAPVPGGPAAGVRCKPATATTFGFARCAGRGGTWLSTVRARTAAATGLGGCAGRGVGVAGGRNTRVSLPGRGGSCACTSGTSCASHAKRACNASDMPRAHRRMRCFVNFTMPMQCIASRHRDGSQRVTKHERIALSAMRSLRWRRWWGSNP